MDVEDKDEEEDDTPEPNAFWVHVAELLSRPHCLDHCDRRCVDVEEALEARQEAVMALCDGQSAPGNSR